MSQLEKLIEKMLIAKADIRFADFEKVLLYAGYTKVRQKGSHAHFRKPDAPFLTIPIHNGKVKIVYVKEAMKMINL